MTSAPIDPLIGRTLDDRYVVRSRIARGGMAMVYLARDLRLERRVAVKVMHAHLADEENFIRRFEQEARSAARLAHPNVVNVFDQGHADGRAYLVMEYLPGITLRDLLKQQRRLTPDQALEIGEAVLSGLAAAHAAGIVHRDLKPENVLLADDGRIKLSDFGLARAVSQNTTTGQALLGTIAYLSPELVTRGIADARSDIYAFGIMMFEMLTGSQPFTGEQPMQIAYQHAHSDVPLPSTTTEGISPELDELVRWTTRRSPDARPRDAGIVLEQLQTIRQDATGHSATRVLPTSELGHITPATAVLDDVERSALAEGAQATPSPVELAGASGDPASMTGASSRAAAASPISAARSVGRRRAKRGRIITALLLVLALTAGGLAYWFAQGPGSHASVPDVTDLTMDEVSVLLSDLDLQLDVFECSSVAVAPGLAVRSEPAAGTRVERQSTVRVCSSTGPEMLPVPTLVGLPVEEAEQAISDAGFSFGSVVEERFSEEETGIVLAAIDADQQGLGDTYAEQATIDLIVSAGPLPAVSGSTVEDATSILRDRGLAVEADLGAESFNDDIAKGQVIRLITSTDPVRPGDPVGLEVSLGPQLFPIPDVTGQGLQDAMDALSEAGFDPTTAVPSALRGFAMASGTTPGPGEEVPLGTQVQVKATINL